MPSRVVVTGVILVIMAALLVFSVEFFLPLSVKSDMNMLCRSALLKMEVEGGLTEQERLELQEKLRIRGFTGVTVTGTVNARQGEVLNLRVEGDYTCSRLTSVFTRASIVQRMIYDKMSMSRKVVN